MSVPQRFAAQLINTMALFGRLSRILLLSGFVFVSLVTAQTETIYLTQISTVFTACQCASISPLGLTVSVLCATCISRSILTVKATPVYI